MEKETNTNMKFKHLVDLLLQGEEQRRQLELELELNPHEKPNAKTLARVLHHTLKKAIDLATSFEAANLHGQLVASGSPRGSGSGGITSPISEGSERKEFPKKRKELPRWTTKVRVPNSNSISPETIMAPEDGYNWRKYGQKEILGAKFPRAYYRCTHQKTQQCLATKQVQRSDEDPTIFKVTYLGNHTCMQNGGQTSMAPQQTSTQELKHNQQVIIRFNSAPTDNLGVTSQSNDPFLFSNNQPDEAIFSPSSGSFGGGFIMSEGTSDSAFFSSFQPQYGDYGEYSNFHGREPELGEIVSGPSSAANDCITQVPGLEPGFPFDPMNPFK
ncbi:hypothetical protein LUZ60_013294 [Juncus effusus]|nr:hypothetical protein LUZ60_013294 [Juncus effusus]